MPEGIKLKFLIYRRVIRWAVGSLSARAPTRRISMTSPYPRMPRMLSVVPAVLFWDNTLLRAVFLLLFRLSYVALYCHIVRFKSPRWLMFPASRAAAPDSTD